VFRLLNRFRVRYLTVGGQAALLHGVGRMSLDVDIFVRPDLANARRILRALSQVGTGMAERVPPEEVVREPITTIRDEIQIDIFTKVPGLPAFDVCHRRRVVKRVAGLRIPCVGIEDLIRSKRGTGRAVDAEDVRALTAILRMRGGHT
jgi:hypothetical protein